MNDGVNYRDDLPEAAAYFALFETTGWNSDYRADAQEAHQAISRSWAAVSAYSGERLVGFGRVISDGALYAVLFDVIVDPEYQNRGIGTEITRRLVRACTEARIREVQLFCAKGKAPFYERLGFSARDADAPGMRLKRR